MAKTKTYLTPYDLSTPVKVKGRTFRKQILPLTTINYKGRKIKFDRPFLADLATSFNDKAYDQVPFVFADEQNRHNESPRNYGGEVVSVDLADDGLYATIRTTREGAKAIASNPRLGVSARIIEGVEKADGRSFPRVLRHVLGTLDPKVTGMGPWQAVNLSEDDTNEVVDLTTETYKEGRMAKNKGGTVVKVGDRTLDLSSLSDEEFQTLLDLAVAAPPKRGTRKTKVRRDADGNVTEEVTEDIEDVLEEDDPAADEDPEDTDSIEDVTDELDDEEEDVDEDEEDLDDEEDPDEDDLDEDDESDEDEDEEEGEPVATTKGKKKAKPRGNPFRGSEEDKGGTDLSNVQTFMDEQVKRQWKSDRREYATAGVPAHLLDLAEPVLSSRAAATIDLANGETIDAGEAMRNMLDGVKGMVDMFPEAGHQVDLSNEEVDEDKQYLDAWDKQFGTV